MKKMLLLLLGISMIAFGKEKSDVKIGVTQIMEHQSLDSARKGFIKALEKEGYGEKNIEYQNAQGDFGTAQIIANSFKNDNKDLILAISTPSAQAAYNATKEIPIIITAVTDAKSSGLVGENITGTSDAAPIYKQLEVAKKLLPQIKKVGVIYNTSEQNSQIQVEQVKEEGKKLGLEVVETGITNVTDMAIGLDTLLPKVDILYTPTDNLVVSATPLVLEKANKAGKPVIGSVEDQVAQGALVTQGIDYEKLGYQTGEIAIRVLNGEKPNSIAIETLKETTLIINKKAAEKYNINMSNEILKDAKVY